MGVTRLRKRNKPATTDAMIRMRATGTAQECRHLMAQSTMLTDVSWEILRRTKTQIARGRMLLEAYWTPEKFGIEMKPKYEPIGNRSLGVVLVDASHNPELKAQVASLYEAMARRDHQQELADMSTPSD